MFSSRYIAKLIMTFICLKDTFQLFTPGGGGWGSDFQSKDLPTKKAYEFTERGSVFEYRKAQESV